MTKFIIYILFCITVCNGKETNKIVGGYGPVSIEECPHVVSLQYQGHHMCGATILTQYHVISSASCVLFEIDSIEVAANLQILTGTNDRFNSDNAGQYHNVQYVIYHPNYEPKSFWKNDMSILKLERPISNTDTSCIINELPRSDWFVKTYGWGEPLFSLNRPSQYLRELNMKLQNKSFCNRNYRGWSKLFKYQACATSVIPYSGITKGNGGNGIFRRARLYGVISLYDVVSLESVVYTNIYYYKSFIFKVLLEY